MSHDSDSQPDELPFLAVQRELNIDLISAS